MIWSIMITAIGLLLVLEGILPFLSPHVWRRVMQQLCLQNDVILRVFGLVSMLLGLVFVSFAHDLFNLF